MTSNDGKQRWIAHVDLDAFFASVEQREHPEYDGQPVVVGAQPGNRGVVAAASYEAREFGIRSAMPIAEAYRRCPEAVFLRPNMQQYKQASQRVFAVLETITPVLEAASIDEAYLDVSGLEKLLGPPEEIGREIRDRIFSETQLTASVGIGPNRLIAKLGSESCKPDGLRVVPQSDVLDFLAPMPVSNLRGLGRQTQKIIDKIGIRTVAELRALPEGDLERHLGARAAASFRRQAMGIASDEIVPDRQRKSISKETTFDTDVTDKNTLRDTLRELAAGVARITRREELAGRVVTLKIRFEGFETHTRQRKLNGPTHDERQLFQTAWQLFERGDLPEKPVRLIGVGISDWAEDEPDQGDLFDQPDAREQDQQLLETIDNVTERFGKGKLKIGLSRNKPR
ncbi:MAG: DNA polymerase IV [Gammaproteobacteria bacterium]